MKVAVVQFSPTDNVSENLDVIENYLNTCAHEGVRLAVFPEFALFTVDAMDDRFVDSAVEIDGEEVRRLTTLSADLGIALVIGINEKVDGSRIYNTLLGIDGQIKASYRKVHLYDAFGYRESDKVIHGDIATPEVFDVDGFTVGMQTCYDLRFPESTRYLVDQGVDVVALPAEWVPGPLKEFHWNTLVRARAIENTVYVLAADQCAPTGAGCSTIIDPMGVALTEVGEAPGIGHALLTRESITQVRHTNPALSLRRFRVVPDVAGSTPNQADENSSAR